MSTAPTGAQTLIFDADDTLWENNSHYARVVDEYVAWLAHPTLEPQQIRDIVAEVEEANIVRHGYGSRVFLRSLEDAFGTITGRTPLDSDLEHITKLGSGFTRYEIDLAPRAGEVLTELGQRHELRMMTKGVPDEQQRKIDASGLAGHFTGIDIVPVKEPATYRTVVADNALDPDRTWMIGNSPRSDIVAARAAGLNAVFVPHPSTWAHEHADLDTADERIVHVSALTDLLAIF